MTPRDIALACLVAVIWGFNFVVIAWGLDGLSPLLFVALRFTLVLFPAIFLVPRPEVVWSGVLQVGLFMCLGQFALVYTAIHLGLSAGLASLVLQAQVIFTIAFAALRLGERPTRPQLAGVLVGTGGLLIVALGRSAATPLPALLVCLGGALSWGWGNVIARRLGAARGVTSGTRASVSSGLSMTVWSGLVVPLPLIVLAVILDGAGSVAHEVGTLSPQVLASAAFTAFFASLLGYSIFNSLLARHPASSVLPFTLLVPPVGLLSAWICLGQRPNAYELLGGCVLLAGVLVTLRRRSPTSPARGTLPRADHALTGDHAQQMHDHEEVHDHQQVHDHAVRGARTA